MDRERLVDEVLMLLPVLGRGLGRPRREELGEIAERGIPVDVHLSHSTHPGNAPVVRDEPDALRPSPHADQAEPAADDRSKSVRSNDDAAPKISRPAARDDRGNTVHPARGVAQYVGHPRAFFNPCACGARPAQEDFIQHRSAQSEAPVAVRRKTFYAREFGVKHCSVRRSHGHPRELGGASALDLVENAHVREYPRCLGTQVFRTHLVTRKARTVEYQNVHPRHGERPRRRRPRRSATYDNYISVLIGGVGQPTARETR